MYKRQTPSRVRILEVVQALGGGLIAAVGDETVGLQQTGRADELVGVPPEAGAAGRAAGAQDALVQAVELVALLGRLQPLGLGRDVVVDEVGLDGVVLLFTLSFQLDEPILPPILCKSTSGICSYISFIH